MFVKERATGDLVRIDRIDQLANPQSSEVLGWRQAGEEEQGETPFLKSGLAFPSDEPLPQCWCDPHYQCSGDAKQCVPADR
ncbi:hypothetical protein CA51_25790 [Rosistilla oblonga]|uniref:Acetyltransferase n=1 Tax=Rosistilla oblonga TaxID=2527990 RepID=A0A518J1K4_9BACT|nr:acetyltransferase [Rosistilla oblonga]QDV12693.1 hypothetical protein CA51_25790 [Rosistilla oblonga]QDV59210.1 hypothetical protein Mal33_52380 [Rosistilla oblonga]